MITIAIIGAAGNMGARACARLGNDPEYRLLYVETGEEGRRRLHELGIEVTDAATAAPQADVVLLAVPDRLIGSASAELVPKMKPGAMVICLDPAAPHAGRLAVRSDLSYFVTHPAHPPVFNDEEDMTSRRDFFGSGLAKQAVVSALMQGSNEDFARGEAIAKKMFGPVLRSHRVTVEQMAILEPALSETLAATCLSVIRRGLDIAVERGVPAEAARDFIMGHINIELAILFDEIDWKFSAGAQEAMKLARRRLFRDDWEGIFSDDEVMASVQRITSLDLAAEHRGNGEAS
ncbi:MAG: NAD(P)-binding domain-containing protein [Pirellulales bacterium]|nr:NAD(P)-binding domain-containing protein [Pirellulales bacterium]